MSHSLTLALPQKKPEIHIRQSAPAKHTPIAHPAAYSDHRDHSVRAIVITCSDHRDRSSERNDARVIVSSLEAPRKWIVDQGRPGGYQGSAPLGERGL